MLEQELLHLIICTLINFSSTSSDLAPSPPPHALALTFKAPQAAADMGGQEEAEQRAFVLSSHLLR